MIKIINVQADYETKPIGLTSPPRLSWWVICDKEYTQESYRIRIGTDFLLEQPLILDTEDIISNDNFYDCNALSLKPFTRYFWQVGVRNAHTGEFAWSDTQEFVTSVLRRSQWKTGVFFQCDTINVLMKRKTFELQQMPEKAYLFIASSGEKSNGYHITLNETKITHDHILPGPLEYIAMQINGFDVTDIIKEQNVINIDHITRVSCVLKLYFHDGTTQVIESDGSWRVYDKEIPIISGYDRGDPATVPQMQHGKYEYFDRRIYPEDWYTYNFDDSDYPPSTTWWGPISLRYCGVKSFSHEIIKPKSIKKTSEGVLVDFGIIQAGYARIMLHSCTEKIVIHYSELLEGEKTRPFVPYDIVTEYYPRGDENEEYTPRFVHASFQYIFIEGLTYVPDPEDLCAVFIHSDIDGCSFFQTSSPEINYMDSCIRRSYLSNLINVPTDCPGRERRAWTADAYVVADSQIIMYNTYNLYARWLRDLKDAQRIGGWCPVEYPDRTDPCVDLNWPMHIALVPWFIYQHTGDKRILIDNIISVEAYADLLDSLTEDDLLAENLYCYGDHVSLAPAGKRFLGAVMYCAYLKSACKIEETLGREEQYATYFMRLSAVHAAINKEFLHITEDAVWYDNDTQTANIMALAMDVCPQEYKERLVEHLVSDINTQNRLAFGMFGSCCLYKVLSENGHIDLAYRLLTDYTVTGSSLLQQVSLERYGTLSENFVPPYKSSRNHMFLGGGPARWFFESLAGINPATPGYKTYEIRPYIPGSMENMQIEMQTPQGIISLSWQKSGNSLSVEIQAPWNAEGVFHLYGKTIKLQHGENKFIMDITE